MQPDRHRINVTVAAEPRRVCTSKSEFDELRNLLILDWSEAFLMSLVCCHGKMPESESSESAGKTSRARNEKLATHRSRISVAVRRVIQLRFALKWSRAERRVAYGVVSLMKSCVVRAS
jgi:hypothetical protein